MSDKLPTRERRLSKIGTAILLVASILSGTVLRAQTEDAAKRPSISEHEFPSEVTIALKAPNKAVLYSLEPWEEPAPGESTLHGFKIIGQLNLDRDLEQTVVAQFKAAITTWDGTGAGCFDPRHGLTVTSGGKTYDFLLCYECGELEIFSGKRMVGDMRARGTGETLNAILSAHKVPLSRSAMELQDSREKAKLAESRWLAAMPSALKPLWPQVRESNGVDPQGAVRTLDPLRAALSKEFPDERSRILALYAWFGSGEGPWSGFPSYEQVAEELLLDFPTETLIKAAEATGSAQQQEGAARLFGGWEISQRRPGDLAHLPADLKKRLLAHSLESDDEDKRSRAHHAFD